MELDEYQCGVSVRSSPDGKTCVVSTTGWSSAFTGLKAQILRHLVVRSRSGGSATGDDLRQLLWHSVEAESGRHRVYEHVREIRACMGEVPALGLWFPKESSYRLVGHFGTSGGSPLLDLLEWVAPAAGEAVVLFSLGTRSHRPFRTWQPVAGSTPTIEQVRKATLEAAGQSYRALATDASGLADIAALIASRRPRAHVRSMLDIEILREFDALPRQGVVTIVGLGMGNVNAVSAEIVRRLAEANVLPRPAGVETNALLDYDGHPLANVTASQQGCIALATGRYRGREVRWLLSAGVGASGTLVSNACLLRLLSESGKEPLRSELDFLARSDAGAVLVTGTMRDLEDYENAGLKLFSQRQEWSILPFEVTGIRSDSILVQRPDGGGTT